MIHNHYNHILTCLKKIWKLKRQHVFMTERCLTQRPFSSSFEKEKNKIIEIIDCI